MIWKDFLREFVLHVFNLHCHPQNVAVATVCLGIGVWMSTTSVASKSFDFEVDNRKHAPVISPTMPDDLTLFGELVPCKLGVREALDRELVVNTYRHSSTMLYLKRVSLVPFDRTDFGRGGRPLGLQILGCD